MSQMFGGEKDNFGLRVSFLITGIFFFFFPSVAIRPNNKAWFDQTLRVLEGVGSNHQLEVDLYNPHCPRKSWRILSLLRPHGWRGGYSKTLGEYFSVISGAANNQPFKFVQGHFAFQHLSFLICSKRGVAVNSIALSSSKIIDFQGCVRRTL